jgi:hypothetical protein
VVSELTSWVKWCGYVVWVWKLDVLVEGYDIGSLGFVGTCRI